MTGDMDALKTTPLTETFGVIVEGVDLSDVSKAAFGALRMLFEEHSALLFRDQTFSDAKHRELAQLFGPIEDRNADERKPDETFEIPKVSNVRADGTTTTEMDLHTDC